MFVNEVFEVEVKGISETINGYAVEKFIRSYSDQLRYLDFDSDRSKIDYIINQLVTWYEDNMSDIMRSLFVANKKEHEKSFQLLLELKEGLN